MSFQRSSAQQRASAGMFIHSCAVVLAGVFTKESEQHILPSERLSDNRNGNGSACCLGSIVIENL